MTPGGGEAAVIVQNDRIGEPWSPLVAIQPAGRGRPFFCVHPVLGTAMVFVPLAGHLGKDRPFYGLEAPGLLDDQPAFDDVGAMAARYVASIRAVQPGGPYLLGGFSFGGLVAVEMARQLHDVGQEVALLAVLDSGTPDYIRRSAPKDGLALLIEVARVLDVNFSLDELGALAREQRLAYAHGHIVAAGLVPAGVSPARLEAHVDAHLRAAQRYAPRVPCRMTFFRASDTGGYAFTTEPIPDFGEAWSACSPHPVVRHDVPGTHSTMIFEPHVRTLAARLRACLDEADPPEDAPGATSER